MIIEIKKEYIREYINGQYGDPPTITSGSNLGRILKPFILYSKPNKFKPKSLDKNTIIEIQILDLKNQNAFIQPENFIVIENVIYGIFCEIFYNYIKAYMIHNSQIKKCILAFCEEKNMVYSDKMYETLKKMWYRSQIYNDINLKKKTTDMNKHNFNQIQPINNIAPASLSCPSLFLF